MERPRLRLDLPRVSDESRAPAPQPGGAEDGGRRDGRFVHRGGARVRGARLAALHARRARDRGVPGHGLRLRTTSSCGRPTPTTHRRRRRRSPPSPPPSTPPPPPPPHVSPSPPPSPPPPATPPQVCSFSLNPLEGLPPLRRCRAAASPPPFSPPSPSSPPPSSPPPVAAAAVAVAAAVARRPQLPRRTPGVTRAVRAAFSTPDTRATPPPATPPPALPPGYRPKYCGHECAVLVGLRAVSANLTKAWPINATHGVCGWEGVRCSRKGEVRSLNLTARGLVGTLPSEIAVLENLEALTVSQTSWRARSRPSSRRSKSSRRSTSRTTR